MAGSALGRVWSTSIEAINGIGHAAVMCDPEFRDRARRHGYTLDRGRRGQRARAVRGAFSPRAAQISRNIDRYEAEWRAEHPGEEPGPRLRRAWDRRAWAEARPDKVVPTDGGELRRPWVEELRRSSGFTPPRTASRLRCRRRRSAALDRDAVVDLALTRLGARRSAWNAATSAARSNGSSPRPASSPSRRCAASSPRTSPPAPSAACRPLLDRDDVPEHVRSLTSTQVLAVEDDIATGSQPRRAPVAPTGWPVVAGDSSTTRSERWPRARR